MSLNKKLLIWVLICSTVATTVFTTASLFFDYKAEMREIDRELAQIEVALLRPIQESLYYFDMKTLEVEISAIVNMPTLFSAVLIESNGNKLLEKHRDITRPDLFKFTKTYQLIQNDDSSEKIGQLTIYGSHYEMYVKLASKTALFFVTQGIKTLIVSFILLWVFQHLVTRHINRMATFFKSYRSDKSESLNLECKELPEELETLENEINELLTKIHHKIEKSKEDLEIQTNIATRSRELASLGEMAGGIAHEINNPLHIISGNLELLGMFAKDHDKMQKQITVARRSCERISKITHGLLHFSRDSNSEYKAHSISKIVDEVLALSSIKASKFGVQISINVSENADTVFCNDVQIGQILINLINNAIDYLVEDSIQEPWIAIKIYNNQGKIIFEISNAGQKIAKDLQAKVFEPFFTTKDVEKGTGLGLSISLGIIQNHGGDLFIDNEREFTTFLFDLPERELPEEEQSALG